MPTSTRRISYVVPFPPAPPPWLQLPSSIHPRNGSPSPLLFPSDHPPLSSHASIDPPSVHPQHSLGVPAMALDTSTQLAGEGHGAGPQGILYTGGRDGLLAGWELGMRLRRRPAREGYDGPGKADWVRWNELGVDGEADDDADGEPPVAAPAGAAYTSDRQRSDGETVPYEDRWEVEEYAEGEVRALLALPCPPLPAELAKLGASAGDKADERLALLRPRPCSLSGFPPSRRLRRNRRSARRASFTPTGSTTFS